jgi:outer membrane biosynthesis protein TonB
MRTPTAISAGLHAAVLLWATVSFSTRSMDAMPAEALPVDLVSESQLTQITKGAKDTEKKLDLKPLVEKVAPEKTPDEIKPAVTEKQEVQASKPKEAAPSPPEPKQEEKKQAKAQEKPVPVAEQKADPIAEALKKEEKKEAKVEKPAPKKLQEPPKKQPEFDPKKIAALLDQRDPKRLASAGDVLNAQGSLGRANGSAAKLSANEIEAFRRRVSECWQPPLGSDSAQNVEVVFRVLFNPDGSVKRGPDIVEAAASSLGPIFAESARRAVLQCQPYTMLHKETYDQWKDLELAFNLRDMFR